MGRLPRGVDQAALHPRFHPRGKPVGLPCTTITSMLIVSGGGSRRWQPGTIPTTGLTRSGIRSRRRADELKGDALPRGRRTAMSDAQILGPGGGKVIPLPGATIVFKALSGRESGDYVVGEFTAEPGFAGPRPHVHRTHEELFYVLEGEFDFLLGDRALRVGPGSFINVPPGVAHDFRNPGTVSARWLGIVCPAGFERYF